MTTTKSREHSGLGFIHILKPVHSQQLRGMQRFKSGLWRGNRYYLLSTPDRVTWLSADVFHNRTRLSQDFSFWGHEEWHLTKWRSASLNNETKNGFKLFEHLCCILENIAAIDENISWKDKDKDSESRKDDLYHSKWKNCSFWTCFSRWELSRAQQLIK